MTGYITDYIIIKFYDITIFFLLRHKLGQKCKGLRS